MTAHLFGIFGSFVGGCLGGSIGAFIGYRLGYKSGELNERIRLGQAYEELLKKYMEREKLMSGLRPGFDQTEGPRP